jgi:AraC-like DNA-binding protein
LYGRASVGLAWRISDELRTGDPLAPWAVDIMANGIAVALTRGSRARAATPPLAHRARLAIERAGYGTVSIARLARELGCTAEHLSRTFRRSYGLTPSRFAMWRRIEQAKRLLLEGTRSVGDIAADLGFSDGSHLGRHFVVWTGVSPGRFRALQRLTGDE